MSSREKSTRSHPVGYGLIGAGGFGRFCLDAYATEPSIECLAVADIDHGAARSIAEAAQVTAEQSVDSLLGRDDIELVHIATPPASHTALVTEALRAGKHVLCEKPLAVTASEGQALVALAAEQDRCLMVNLIMRYDPINRAVKRIIEQNLLGEVLHGFFENYAKDQPLGPDHWFWDPSRSGGIFVEHGVHFFDLLEWFLGPGEVESAQSARRPGTRVVDQVQCSVRYGSQTLINFYHGFIRPEILERQELRLVFEQGLVTLDEWLPTTLEIDCLADSQTVEAIEQLLPESTCQTLDDFDDRAGPPVRWKPSQATGRFGIHGGAGMNKTELYQHVLRSLIADMAATIGNPEHRPTVDAQAAERCLLVAEQARDMASAG
jgi:predicted dehydrogenase